MANKWTFKASVRLTGNQILARLIQFYVWETPVPGVSQKGKTFQELGWTAQRFSILQAGMRSTSSLARENWVGCPAKNMNLELKRINRFESFDCSFEFAIHSIRSGLNKTEALFYLIRNGFAHGGFRVCSYRGEKYFVFESTDRGTLKGRAVLKQDTLLAWMKLVKKGPFKVK